MKRKWNYLLAGALAAWTFTAAAGPLPNSSYLGDNKAFQITNTSTGLAHPNSVTIPSPGTGTLTGGGFEAKVGTASTFGAGSSALTTVWCVDSQYYLSTDSNLQANITSLASAFADPNKVQYGNLSGVGVGATQWKYAVKSGTDTTTALDRYRMAAYLISKYSGFPDGPTPNATDDALQLAIWKIMRNNTGGNNDVFSGVLNSVWIDQAYTFAVTDYDANASFFNQWAVVSWDVNSDGSLNSSAQKQTFLVQIVPEPAFYGLLSAGLAGLFLAARRRKTVNPESAE